MSLLLALSKLFNWSSFLVLLKHTFKIFFLNCWTVDGLRSSYLTVQLCKCLARGIKYSVKFVEGSLLKIWRDMVSYFKRKLLVIVPIQIVFTQERHWICIISFFLPSPVGMETRPWLSKAFLVRVFKSIFAQINLLAKTKQDNE